MVLFITTSQKTIMKKAGTCQLRHQFLEIARCEYGAYRSSALVEQTS